MTRTDRVVLVTGASRGLGAAVVKRLAARGDRVVINYVHHEATTQALRDALAAQHGPDRVLAVRADVRERAAVRAMFDAALQHFGSVDVLVNNAGLNQDRAFLEMTDEEWTTVVSTILDGSFTCSQEFALRFAGEEGHIVNLGALTAFHGRKNGVNYCAARAGVLVLTKCLAQELAPRIRVNSVTPGYIETEELVERYHLDQPERRQDVLRAIPLGALGSPEAVAGIVEFIVHESEYITGQNFIIDGGCLMV